ncbi:malonyl-ACP O-methyltransferase BioC [Aestuariicella hydrocarbonica]|uniref:Malonyl-[acyl-carrier protein] O-methyltransferase n=1 Tax=Pseudomaricurvus hydrocarbonicus TaxID=1470433 RepID=A0A9E5MMK6_9GAMM|nr:malonyl-ACP O-methyltransferase BioC [Aestuariicella hydrocarbonica]NHO67002.1 malonyl-ACP O-methyltransferase BioC [Aestuariicella hydrocarbonica]
MITLQTLPAQSSRAYAEPLVLLHGWGCDSRSWQPLLDRLNETLDVILVDLPGFGRGSELEMIQTADDFCGRLMAVLPRRFLLLGWSLGGMLATRLAAQYPQRVLGLITLASNLKFVASQEWPSAMPRHEFDAFAQGFTQSAELTLKRFAALTAKGDIDNERGLLKSLRQQAQAAWLQAGARQLSWRVALSWLDDLDNRQYFAGLSQPGLHLLAEDDALVPGAAAQAMGLLNRQQKIKLLDGCAHALHWSRPERVSAEILTFVDAVHYAVDKRKVAESFGRAADKYDSVAGLQRQIGHNLLSTVQPDSAGHWLDLGSGTGYFTPQLVARCESVLGLDLSEGMLRYSRQHHGCDNIQWLCGDAEAIPLADACLSGVFSSLAIQWCANLPQLFAELKRVLKPGGRLSLATLGPGTLHELRAAWSEVDKYTHVNHFASEASVRQAIADSGLTLERWQTEHIVLRYQQVRELTYELKTLGAHNMNHGQSSGLTGRQRITQFKQAYEQFRHTDGHLPATYEVFYLELSH